jgi:hypothetical protein
LKDYETPAEAIQGLAQFFVRYNEWRQHQALGYQTHIPHPSDGDPRHFLAAIFARTTNPLSGMVSSHERRYTKHLRPWRVVWVSCSRLSKRTKSNICPL